MLVVHHLNVYMFNTYKSFSYNGDCSPLKGGPCTIITRKYESILAEGDMIVVKKLTSLQRNRDIYRTVLRKCSMWFVATTKRMKCYTLCSHIFAWSSNS